MKGPPVAQDDADRINGLMAAMGRKETENAQLRAQIAQLTEQEPAQAGGLAGEPQWEPGTRLEVDDDGQLVEYQPPQPQNPNETNRWASGDPTGTKQDDGSADWAKDQMIRQLGGAPDKPWL
jgi:hypothetical protein